MTLFSNLTGTELAPRQLSRKCAIKDVMSSSKELLLPAITFAGAERLKGNNRSSFLSLGAVL
jgi:hypothetical protein